MDNQPRMFSDSEVQSPQYAWLSYVLPPTSFFGNNNLLGATKHSVNRLIRSPPARGLYVGFLRGENCSLMKGYWPSGRDAQTGAYMERIKQICYTTSRFQLRRSAWLLMPIPVSWSK